MKHTHGFHTNSQGGIRRRVVAVLVFLLIAAGVSSWWFLLRETGETQRQEVTTEETIKCKSDDETLCKFITSWEAPEQYRFTIRETAGNVTKTSVLEYDLREPAKIRAVVDGTEETITIGNTLYINRNGTWTKQTISGVDASQASENEATQPPSATDTAPIEPNHYKKAGTEPCGQLTCYKYQVLDPENPDLIQYIWFDDQEYKLRQLRFESAGVISDQVYDYVPVNITEPSPVQG